MTTRRQRAIGGVVAALLALVTIGLVLTATWTVDGWTAPQRLLATAGVAGLCALFIGLGSME
jgi:hypothetical protein